MFFSDLYNRIVRYPTITSMLLITGMKFKNFCRFQAFENLNYLKILHMSLKRLLQYNSYQNR